MAKGGAFERLIAKIISKWLTYGASKTELIRSDLSGGWRQGTASPVEGWRQVGDLAPNGSHGEAFRRRFAVECKHRQDELLWPLLTQTPTKNNILGWWEKLEAECDPHHGLIPLLLARQNSRPILLATRLDLLALLRLERGLTFEWADHMSFGLILFDDFLRKAPDAVYDAHATLVLGIGE